MGRGSRERSVQVSSNEDLREAVSGVVEQFTMQIEGDSVGVITVSEEVRG